MTPKRYPTKGERYAYWLGTQEEQQGGLGTLYGLLASPTNMAAYRDGVHAKLGG